MPSRAIPRWLGPWILVAGGVVWTLILQSNVQPGVYFSGDGGLKAQVVEQFAAGHWTPKLMLDAEPWVRDLWEDGFYPFGPPFVWDRGGDRVVAFPLPFLVLSTPPFQSFGHRGLYLLPLLATWAVWIRFLFLGRRLRLSGLALGLGFVALIFASHLTLYSAVFWEHSLAVALAFCGLAEMPASENASRPMVRLTLGGLLMGLAAWLRPECATLVVGALAAWPLLWREERYRGWIAIATGSTIALLGFGTLNLALYGTPVGLHAEDVLVDASLGTRVREAVSLIGNFAMQLARFAPVAALGVLVILLPRVWKRDRPADNAKALLLTVAVFLVGTALIVPNVGGKQWGPRYLLPVVPPLCLATALLVDTVRERLPRAASIGSLVVLIAALGYGADRNVRIGTRELARDYSGRILPILDLVRRSGTELVVVTHQWQAQELQAAFTSHRFFRVSNAADVDRLVRKLARQDRRDFLWLEFPGEEEPESGDIRMPSGLWVHKRLLNVDGAYAVFRCTIEVTNAPA